MSTKIPANPNPFTDPNAALQMFNQYFGRLRDQYGEDVVRQVGFTPKEFQDLQASLRKLQLDPRATPEQHREAYMQARDTLARRLTTPLEATRAFGEVPQPKPAPSPAPAVGNDGTMPPVVPMPVMSPDRKSPTQEQIYSYARAVGQGETGLWDPTRGVFVMTAQPPQPQQGGLTQAAPYDAAAAYRQNAQKLAEAVKAGQITVERARQLQAPLFAATKLGSTPEGQAAMNAAAAQAQGGMPMSGYDAAAQYRNFGQELMGMIKSGALTVEQANALKAPVFNAVKLGNSNAGYQQMQAALAAARQRMGEQDMGVTVKPVMPQPMPQPQEIVVTGQRMPEPQPPMPVMPPPPVVYDTFRPTTPPPMPVMPPPVQGGGIGAFLGKPGEVPQVVGMPPQLPNMFKPPQPTGVDNTTFIAGDPNFRFGETPQVKAPNAQGMAMGGLLRKYYGGGMC